MHSHSVNYLCNIEILGQQLRTLNLRLAWWWYLTFLLFFTLWEYSFFFFFLSILSYLVLVLYAVSITLPFGTVGFKSSLLFSVRFSYWRNFRKPLQYFLFTYHFLSATYDTRVKQRYALQYSWRNQVSYFSLSVIILHIIGHV